MAVASGYTWELDPADQSFDHGGRTRRKSVRAVADPKITAIAKFAPSTKPEEVYGLGMERVASRLGALLGLPIPSVWLEDVDGEPAAVVRRVQGTLAWSLASIDVRPKITNRDVWPLSVVFDVWLANFDRADRNLLIAPLPEGTEFRLADEYSLWLIDHGCCGLLWASKFDSDLTPHDVAAVHVDRDTGEMLERCERTARQIMPREYTNSFWTMEEDERDQTLDHVRQVADDELDEIVDEIPDAYMGATVREETKALLKCRRDRVDTLMNKYWA